MIRNSQKNSTIPIIPGISLELNPFTETLSARRMENWILDRGRLIRAPFSPIVSSSNNGGYASSSGFGTVLKMKNFRYYRNSAPENKFVLFDTLGYGYLKKNGAHQPFFPGTTSFSALKKKPYLEQLGNRLFFSDGASSYVYDGRDPVQAWGLSRSTTAPTTSAVAAGSLTAATGLKACITWAVLDEASNRVHESSRSNVSAFQILAAENLRVDISALSAPARATHWSAYISELDGSNIYRRAATTAIGTTTVDISALPASTTPKAPIRNDPPPPSSVGCTAKNRHFVRDDANPNRFYFSALGEVEGLLNGSGPESFPGYGTNSVSDLVNSDTVPDREIRAIIEHENVIYIFTESRGYALVGELNLLDSRSPRSLVKLQQFNEGCIGPDAACSTPYGLVWMSPSRKIWLWNGASELVDLGRPIQQTLNEVAPYDSGVVVGTTPELQHTIHLHWWSGKDRQWLIFSAANYTGAGDRYYSSTGYMLDFSISAPERIGSWIAYGGGADSENFQDDDGTMFLFQGTSDGTIQLRDVFASPSHLNQSFILGKTYLGSTVQENPNAFLYSNLFSPNGDIWCTGQYLSLVHGDQNSASAGSTTAPTVAHLVDVETVDNLGDTPGITLTLDTATTANEKRAWLIPESSGNTNRGGAFGKNFAVFLYYSTTDKDTTTDASGRELPVFNTINRLAFTWSGQKDLSA